MRLYSAILLALTTTFSTSVLAETYDCKINKTSWGGWVTERYIFQVDNKRQSVIVLDAISQKHLAGPVATSVKKMTDRSVRFRWTLRDLPAFNRATGASTGTLTITYSGVLNFENNTVLVRGTVVDGGGGSSGEGTCVATRLKLKKPVNSGANSNTDENKVIDKKCLDNPESAYSYQHCK